MTIDDPPLAETAFGFRAFTVITLVSLAFVLQSLGVYFFLGDIRTPM